MSLMNLCPVPRGVVSTAIFNISSIFASGEQGFWYDPSDLSTLFQDSAMAIPVTAAGQPVVKMLDKSGNGNTLTLTNATLQQDSNGLYYINFDGTASGVTGNIDFTSTDKISVWAACYKTNKTTGGVLLELTGSVLTNAGSMAIFAPSDNNKDDYGFAMKGAAGATYGAIYAAPFNGLNRLDIVHSVYDMAGAAIADEINPQINGATPALDVVAGAPGPAGTGNFANAKIYLGKRAGTSLPFFGRLYAAIVRGADSSTNEKLLVNTYIANKVNVSLLQTAIPTQFSDSRAVVATANYLETSAHAHADYQTTATTVRVESYNNMYNSSHSMTEIGVYVDGVYNQSINPGATGRHVTEITLPAGDKSVSFVNGPQSRPNLANPVIGTFIKRIWANAPLSQINLTSPANRLLVYGDSISAGSEAVPVMEKSWVELVRAASYPNSVALEGWGYRALHDDAHDAAARSSFVAKLVSYAPTKLWLAIGTNDMGLGRWSAVADFGAAYAAVLDDLHSALPDLIIYCQTPILRSSESNLGEYRTQISNAVSTRTSFCTLVDGTEIMTTAELFDGVHPTTAGHILYADYVKSVLGVA